MRWWALGGTVGALVLMLAGCGRNHGHALAPPGTGTAILTAVGPPPGVASTIGANMDAPNPLGGDAVTLRQGRELFKRMNCAGCHGDHAGGGMGPSLRDSVWIYGGTNPRIFASIAEGRAHGMPAWGTVLPERQIWQLVAYIRSLRTPQEPEPPQ